MSVTTTPQQTGTASGTGGPIESREQYAEGSVTPEKAAYDYWSDELKGSAKMLDRWHRQADRIHKRYLDERTSEASSGNVGRESPTGKFRLNLFFANVNTLQSLLYGNLPKIDVSRRYHDAKDDVGRVAGVMMERMLNNDVVDNEEEIDSVLKACLADRLVPGLGVARVRYDCEVDEITIAAVVDQNTGKTLAEERTEKRLRSESAPIEYYHWRDVLWSWSRTYAGLRWLAFRNFVTKKDATKRYGAKVAGRLTYKQQKLTTDTQSNDVPDDPSHNEWWSRAEIWEIWDKEERKIIEVHLDYDNILSERPDPLGLRKFFPCPSFFIANPTTSLYKPTPDWHMVQDLYNEIDKLQTRIAIITEAVKVVGVYDASSPEIQRMMKEGVENDLIPVDKWAMLAEKGGLKGMIDWFPIKDVVDALINLRQLRDETIELLYQVSGMADVMRGQLANQYEGVGQTDTKMKFASVRVQSLQEQFATFVTGLMRLKAEVIANHFEAESIIRLSNADASFETPELIAEAVALIQDPQRARLRVKVKAESLASTDYARMQAERGEFLTGLSAFMGAAAPLVAETPEAGPYLMQLLQWGLAGFRGADEIEGVIDQALIAMEEAKKQPKRDPEVDKETVKAQGQIQLVQAKAQAEMQTRDHDLQADVQTKQVEHNLRIQEIEAEMRAAIAQLQAKAQADMVVEEHQSSVNANQAAQTAEAELNKDIVNRELDLQAEADKAAIEIKKARAIADAKPKTDGGDS